MPIAIRPTRTGGPEVLVAAEISAPAIAADQVRVRTEALGVNFIDIYQRSGQYPMPLPLPLGMEGAGIVTEVGAAVKDLSVGQRVAWAGVGGSYASEVVVPAARAVPVPYGVSAQMAAALIMQGLTAHYLAHSTFALQRGHTALIHAAAGGVGLLLVQLAKRAGATVFATTSTAEKTALVCAQGADHAIPYADFAAAVRRLNGGRGVDVVYDSVGKDTFAGSLDCLAPRGLLALFGQSSGAVPAFDPQLLAGKGSLFLTRPTLKDYIQDRAELTQRCEELFTLVAAGTLNVRIDSTLPLADAAEAHRRLASRATTGKVLLIP